MSDPDATTPRVFLICHGETEDTKNGLFPGGTDPELTPAGESQVVATRIKLVGPGKLIDPANVAQAWISPRKRARRTFELLFADGRHGNDLRIPFKATLTEYIAEWDFGRIALFGKRQIRELQNQVWDIDWDDGADLREGEYDLPHSCPV
ncbi:uncharacterized protein KY384_008092 [Bacidia gigantensis]|uniref:uncharacterized protein n=1 Tax=Bacidia gigantensis TaxID=2732470 RepID=UPI001D056EA8|nr:uncharacterized protein KY384_008092 [Bacidia gigantensis]KAG8526663.1 hypothetical protein KY384_008092 [Bacidia gigantensis]